jgi:HTH-type transcriptional regulator/antitoxin HipB
MRCSPTGKKGPDVSELDLLKAELLDSPQAKAEYRRKVLAMRLGEQVRQLREAAGFSQEELARRIGTKQPGIARLERGSGMPTLDMLDRVALALGVELLVGFRGPSQARGAKAGRTTSSGTSRSGAGRKTAAAEKSGTAVKAASLRTATSSGTSRRTD